VAAFWSAKLAGKFLITIIHEVHNYMEALFLSKNLSKIAKARGFVPP